MPDVKVELGLSQVFTLDDPVAGVIGNTEFVLSGETFVEVTDRVRALSITRGKNRDLDRFDAGTLSVEFNNFDRAFDPLYSSSPFAGNIVPRRNVRVSVDDLPQYTGKVVDWNIQFEPGGVSVASLEAADAFTFLAQQELEAGTATVQTSGARVGAVLDMDTVKWPTADRDIDTGASTLGADEFDGNVLDYLNQVALTEQGLFFIGKDGKVVFRDRLATPTVDNVTVFSEGTGIPFTFADLDYGVELLFNQVTVTSNAGTAVANDALSQTRYGIIQQSFDTLLDSGLQDYADFIVGRYGEPELRFAAITVSLDGLTTSQRADVLGLEIGDVVQVEFTPANVSPQVSRYGLVIGVSHDATPDQHTVTFSLGSLQTSLFVVGDSEFGIIDVDAPGVLGF